MSGAAAGSLPEAWLRLALAPEIGPVLAHRLLHAFATPQAVFEASGAALQGVAGLGPTRLAGLLDRAAEAAARSEIELAAESGVRFITLADAEYPALLRQLPHPPLVLWVRGRLAPEDRLALAMVGPRRPSQYATLMAQRLAPELAARGLTLVSGLAYGVDAAAHSGALEQRGRTLAVVGQGLATPVYPPTNTQLAERIIAEDRGAIVSIFPLRTEPAAGLFPQRNEIIAGLALGTLVVEAAPESGSLITARHAAALGRTVLACPGDATRRAAQGSNRLLADGAALVQNAEDVLAALASEMRVAMGELGRELDVTNDMDDLADADGVETPKPARAAKAGASGVISAPNPVAQRVLELLDAEPLPGDVIMERCAEHGLTLPQVLEALLNLELAGTVRQLPGRLYARKM